MSLSVEIVTPVRRAFEGTAAQVQAPGWLGEFGALPEHAAMLSLSRAGVVTLHGAEGTLSTGREPRKITETLRLVVGSGFVEVGPDRVVLLVDAAEAASDVDRAAAERDLKAAEEVLAHAEPSSPAWILADKQAKLAQARLSV